MKRANQTTQRGLRPLAFAAVVLALGIVAVTAPAAAEEARASAIMGKETFRAYCASCHGPEAEGDGAVAEYLKVPPADLTTIAARNEGEFPAERVFRTIEGREKVRGHGGSEMPVWGDAFSKTDDAPDEAAVERKIAELVEFLRSIQKPSEPPEKSTDEGR